MKLASIQLDIQWHDKTANLEKAAFYVEKAMLDGCELIVFPEMFNTGFSMDTKSTLEKQEGHSSRVLCELARQFEINIIAGITQEKLGKGENVALFINKKGKIVSRYVKNYPFKLAGEHKHYSEGNEQVLFDLGSYRASLFICYDLRFPELFRKVAKDVDMIFIIASWPIARQNHWEVLLQARAIENQCFVVGVNRIGSDGNGLEYGGGSHVFSPAGVDLSSGTALQEYIVTEVILDETKKLRQSFPYLEDIKTLSEFTR